MPVTFKKLTKKIFILLTIAVSAITLIGCLVPWLNAGVYWWVAVIGLGMPLLVGMVFLLLLMWIFFRSRWFLLPLITLLLSSQQILAFFAFGFEEELKPKSDPGHLRVLSWNISHLDQYNGKKQGRDSTFRRSMLEIIRAQDADVVCLQEFFEPREEKHWKKNISLIEETMGLPYHYFAVEISLYTGAVSMGNIIFSRYPIVDSATIKLNEDPHKKENAAICDIDVNGKRIRVMTTHLQSVLFRQSDYQGIDGIKKNQEQLLNTSKTIISKLKRAYWYRSSQAEILKEIIGQSPYPVIFTGDFNDVPNSYTYFTIRGNMRDAFLEEGGGIGRTFRRISPTLRIDYIFADEQFPVLQYGRVKVPYSDHYPHVVDLALDEAAVSD